MPRPSDWDAIGLGSDPTPGEPETIGQLAEVLQKLGGKARDIFNAIQSVMNTNNDSVFVGQTADALRGKVDDRLRGHVEDVANAFETSAQALRDWRGVVEEQQRKADAALAAGRGLAEDDPARDTQKGIAEQAGRDQSDQASTYSGRINGVSDIQLPISSCEAFWEAFKWLAIILIIPALIFGGPIALLALGVNLALFIKTIVDVAKGDASFLDLFLAGLGLIAPTTKALPIFSIIKGIAQGIGAGVKGVANAFRTIFSKDFLFKAMTGLKGLPFIATLSIKETGLFVVSNIRNFAISVGNFGANFGSITLGALGKFGTAFTQLPGTIVRGFGAIGKGIGTVWNGGKQFVSAHFGGLQWTRLILPVAADEIRAFKAIGMTDFQAFTQALKVGVFGRGLAGQHVFGLPMVSALGHTVSAIPINTPKLTFLENANVFFKGMMQPPKLEPSVHLNGFGFATESGITAGKAFDDLHLPPMNTNLGQGLNTPTVVTPGGVHVPATTGMTSLTTNLPSPHIGQASVNGMNGMNGVNGIHGLVENLPASNHVGIPGVGVNNVTQNVAIPGSATSFTHSGMNVTPPTTANVGSLHVATPGSTSVGDLVSSGLRNNTPTISPHFATSINEGVSHGFQANHLRLSLDEITRTPTPATNGTGHVLNPPPSVDRVNAALDLVTGGPADLKVGAPGNLRTDNPSFAGVQNVTTPPTAHVQPVSVPKTDVPLQAQVQPHTFSPGKSEIPLNGLPDHPGLVVKVERFDGGVSQFNLHGGGPNGRLDPLNGGGLRFTDTSTGVTTRFDSNGIVVDQGVRLTKADGLARIDDRVLIRRPDGEFRITSLDGTAVPDQLTIRALDTGGVQVLGKDGMTWHYGANGKLESQSVDAAWNGDLAAKAGVFKKPGDTDAMVDAKMDDFTSVQQAQRNVDLAHDNVAIHGERIDGPSNAPSVGDQVHLDLHGAQHDLDLAKNAFEGKHGLNVDGIQKQLDDITTDSLNVRPRLLGAGRTMTYDVPGNAGVKFDVNGGQVSVHGPGSEEFTSTVVGKTLTISGNGHTWTYSLGFGGRANHVGESFPLNGGLFDGKPVALEGKLGNLDSGVVDGKWSVKVGDDGLVVASPHGPLRYGRDGAFHGIGATATGDLPRPVPPPQLAGDDLARWNAQVDLSRTHLTEAAGNKAVENLMKDVTGGSFTSKRGYGGYVNPTALADGTLVAKVKNFDTVAKDLQFKGPADHITVYRGVSMDPISAQADEFVERLPISTSSTLKFQDDWAKNGVDSNRVVFKVDVPPNHGKLAMSYPEGYHPGGGEARAWNQDQWEITLGPAKFTRTGPDIFENGHRIIPVKAEPIPAGAFDDVITAKWPGLSSEAAFGDFVKSFETSNLRGFEGLEDITTRATTSVDGLSHTVHVGKPGSGDELTITVLRDPQADSVRVIWTADGANQFDKTWRGQDFSNLATDLRGNVLHNNDQFLGMPKPASWAQTHFAPPPLPPPTVATHGPVPGGHLPARPQRVVAPEFGKTFDDASFGTESELGGFVVAMPEGSHRVFAFVKKVDTDESLVMVTKDMSNGVYRNPGNLPVAHNGNWTTHTVELVNYPSRLGDQAGIALRDDATQFLLDTFKSRLTGANHQPMDSILSADGRFKLEITNTRHVIAGGSGMQLDDAGSVTMPLGGQQLTVGVKASDFAGGTTNELRLLRDNPWYNAEFRNDDAVRNLDHAGLDNPEAVESAYTYLKSIISFTAKQVDKHGIPIGNHPGASPFHSLTDPAVKNDWAVLPRTRPNLVLAGLSDVDKAATLKLLRDMPSIGDGAIWRESKLYILGGGEVAGHGINDAVIGGEKALLFEFRTVPDGLKQLVPTQKLPVASITDLLADLGAGRPAAVKNINGYISHADNSGDFAGWFRDKFPNHATKTDQRVITISTVQQKAEWMMTHNPNAWDQVLAGQEPVIVRTVQLPQIQQHPLGGAFDHHTVVRPEGGTTHVTGPNAHQFQVVDLPDGGFRVIGTHGQMQRYDVNGAHLGDGVMLRDPFNVQDSRFAEGNGTGGFHATDLNGTQVPHTRVEQLGDGVFRVSDDTIGDVRWFDRTGIQRGAGIRVADPAHPGQVFLYRAHGMDPVLIDNAGARLPGTVETFDGGGFRINEANGTARTFDGAGIYLDRRIPLGGNQTIIHDVNNNLTLQNSAGTVHQVQGGYRVVDHGNYQVYDADGVFQAHGHTVDLPGQNGFLEITGTGARRLDGNYQPIPGRNVTFDAAAGEITVTRAGGHDVFDLQGGVLREVTDLDAHGLGVGTTRVTRDQNGVVTWTDRNGAPVPTPHRVTIDQQGAVRLEINVPGGPRNGEFHVFSRDGQLTEQGFPVVRNGQPTEFTYVVNRTDNTWRRVDSHNLDGTGSFQHGKVDVAGLDNGRIRLQSSTAKEVEVFERRWLPDGTILDSFRKTDTLGYSWFDRRTTWATYDANGVLTNWGKRHLDTGGSSWRDYDHQGNVVRDYQQGLQKYANPIADQMGPLGKAEKEITGHVLAIKDGRQWRWNRYDADGLHIASGDRTLETIGEGWTDTVRVLDGNNEVTVIAQQKWGTWHGPDKARQYQEFKLEAGATHPTRSGEFEVQSPQLKSVGNGELLNNGALLKTVRQGDQRPPIWVRENFLDNPPTVGAVSHISGDDRFQIFRWETSGDGIDAGRGIRYVGTDESVVDVDLNGAFVRSKGKLHNGTELKVGDHATAPATAHPNATTPWTAGDLNGWRVFDNNNGWRDVAEVDGVQGWTVVRESHPGGAVREFPQPADRNIWVQRDPHGNLVGSSHQTPASVGGNHRYVVATGAADSSHWRWRELDHNGVPIAGREGDRFHFKGSSDENISWDNSFRDFDAGGNLIRDRHLLAERRFVESWQDGGQWRVAEFDKTGQEVAGTTRLDRRWRAADGTWQQDWTAGSQHFRDSLPQNGQVGPQVVRETPPHVGDGRPIRVREYTLNNGQTDFKQWKEFDFDKVVRERVASGNNYLETDKIHSQWKLYDADGQVIGERSDNGLVFELRDGRLTLTGNEFDFRGALTEYRGWNTRIGDTQRQPWLMQSDLTMADLTLTPGGTAFREANYAPFSRLLTQKVLLQVGTEFILDYAASLMIAGIVAEAQNKPFTGNDALKALMNAAVGATLKSVAGAALTETKLGGSLRNLKQSLGNLDGGKFITKRPNNNDATWGVEWAGNTSPARWRGGTFDYSLNMLLLPLTGFVNGTMNAAIFGVPNADGKTVKLSGWQAVGEGGMAVLSGYAISNSLGLLKLVGGNFSAGRFFQKAGFADIVLTMPLRLFEKGIGGAFLTPAIRASINPSWYQVPPVEGAQ